MEDAQAMAPTKVITAVLVCTIALLGLGSVSADAAAPAVPAAGTITITSPTPGQEIHWHQDVPMQLALSSDLSPGKYAVAITQGADVVWDRRPFTLSAADIAAGTYTFNSAAFPATGSYRLDVERLTSGATPYEVLDSVSVTSVSNQPPGWRIDISPDNGSGVPAGYAGPVTVRLQNLPAGDYTVDIQDTIANNNPRDYTWHHVIQHDGTKTKTYALNVPAFTVPETHWITVENIDLDVYQDSQFEVINTVKLTADATRYEEPADFYPLVHDGFRDTTNIAYRANMRTHVAVRVLNSAGNPVRQEDLGTRTPDRHLSWTWNGKDNKGQFVPKGAYTIELTGSDDNGYYDKLTRRVTATTDVVTRTDSLSVKGSATSSRQTRGNCYTNSYYGGELHLDCWAGTYAQATYNFRVPRSATNLALDVRGEAGCCEEGQTTRTGSRINATTYRVTVRVTNWHAYTVKAVRLRYRYELQR